MILGIYKLAAGTDAHNPPGVIRPIDFDAVTNPRVWKLLGNDVIALIAAEQLARTEADESIQLEIDGLVPFTGGTMTGPLTLYADPTTPLMGATKGYVDAVTTALGLYLPLVGGTLAGPGNLTVSGNLGVGTTAHDSKLVVSLNLSSSPGTLSANTNVHIIGANTSNSRFLMDSFGGQVAIQGRRANGTAASPSGLVTDDVIGTLGFTGYGATDYVSASKVFISAYASEDWTDTTCGTHLTISTTNNTSSTPVERVRVTNAGFVGFGTSIPTAIIDAVGTIRSTAQTVPSSGAGLELIYTSNIGYLTSFDRSGSVYKDLVISGLATTINAAGGNISLRPSTGTTQLLTTGTNSTLVVYDSGPTENVALTHTGTYASLTTTAGDINIVPNSGTVNLAGHIIPTVTATDDVGSAVKLWRNGYFSGSMSAGRLTLSTCNQWSSTNFGDNIIITGTRNNSLGIFDSTGSNPWAMGNQAGNLRFAQMPALGDVSTAATYLVTFTTAGDVQANTFSLPSTTSSSVGCINLGATRFAHAYKASGADGQNTFVGQGAGNFTMSIGGGVSSLASYNVGVGMNALTGLTTGLSNVAVGRIALAQLTSGTDNIAIGVNGQYNNLTGTYNVSIGSYSQVTRTAGACNVSIGTNSLRLNVTGNSNTAVGDTSLLTTTGSNNVAIGYYAGTWETGSNTFYVNNQNRSTTAADKTDSLLYGIFAASPANQRLTVNANVGINAPATTSALWLKGASFIHDGAGTAALHDLFYDKTTYPNLWARLAQNASGGLYIQSNSGGAAWDGISFINDSGTQFYIATTGNIGIGTTTTTSSRVTIAQTNTSTTAWSNAGTLRLFNTDSTANNWEGIDFAGANSMWAGGIVMVNTDHTNGYGRMDFGIRGSSGVFGSAISILDGKVGINTNTHSTFTLQVAGHTGPNANATYDLGSSAVKWRDAYLSRNLTVGGTLTISTGASSGYFLQCDSSGNASWALVAASQVYKGTWDASANTPTLANGTGTSGWYYRCSVSGTVNLGSGNITFTAGDDVTYNGTIWQRIPGVGYTLVTATSTVLGGVKVGTSLSITASVLDVIYGTTSGSAARGNHDHDASGIVSGVLADVRMNALTTATGSSVVKRDSNGDTSFRYANASYFNSSDDVSAGNITYVMAKFGDNYYRSASAAKLSAFIGSVTGSGTTGTVPKWSSSTGLGDSLMTISGSAVLPTSTASYDLGSTTVLWRSLYVGTVTASTFLGNLAWSYLTGVPSTFTPASHAHAQSDVTNLVTDLSNKEAKITYDSVAYHFWSGTGTWQSVNYANIIGTFPGVVGSGTNNIMAMWGASGLTNSDISHDVYVSGNQKYRINADWYPNADNTFLCGSGTARWSAVYAVNFYGTFNGTVVGALTGSGTTGTVPKWSSSTGLSDSLMAVSGSAMVPTANISYDLGSTTATWRALYVTQAYATTFNGALAGNAATASYATAAGTASSATTAGYATTAGLVTNQANSATIACSPLNNANQIVQRDASGNFAAGVVSTTNVTIGGNNVWHAGNLDPYRVATSTVVGGIKVGPSLTISAGVLDVGTVVRRQDMIALMGDSITMFSVPAGTPVGTTQWVTRMPSVSLVWDSLLRFNYAVGGYTTSQMVADYATTAHTSRPAATTSQVGYFLVWGGVNDLYANVAASTIYANLVSLWASARADGYIVIAVTPTSAAGFSTPQWTQYNSLISLILSDPTKYDLICRPEVVCTTMNAPYGSDGIHPSFLGASLIAAEMTKIIDSYRPFMVTPAAAGTTSYSNWDLILNSQGRDVYAGIEKLNPNEGTVASTLCRRTNTGVGVFLTTVHTGNMTFSAPATIFKMCCKALYDGATDNNIYDASYTQVRDYILCSTNNSGDTVCLRDANADINARDYNGRYIQTTDAAPATVPTYLIGKFGSNFHQSVTKALTRDFIGCSTNNTGDTVCLRDINADINARNYNGSYIQTTDATPATVPTYLIGKFGTNFHQSVTKALARDFIGCSTNNTGDTVCLRDANADINARNYNGSYIQTTDDTPASGLRVLVGKFGVDNFHRSVSAAMAKTWLNYTVTDVGGIGGSGAIGAIPVFVTNTTTLTSSIMTTGAGSVIISGDFVPYNTTTSSLGSSAKRWASVYATTFTGALVGNADTATNAANSALLSGLAASTNNTGSTICQRDANADINARNYNGSYIQTTDDAPTTGLRVLVGKFGLDNFHRSASASVVKTWLSLTAADVGGPFITGTGTITSGTIPMFYGTTAITSTSLSMVTGSWTGLNVAADLHVTGTIQGNTVCANGFNGLDGGNIVFQASCTPTSNNTLNLGSSLLKWASVYATTFYGNLTGTASDSLLLNGMASAVLATINTIVARDGVGSVTCSSVNCSAVYCGSASTLNIKSANSIEMGSTGTGTINVISGVFPTTSNALNLGSSTLKWASVYATTFYGALTGNASSASSGWPTTWATSAITSGTFDIARIPTGTTGTTVALGNHTQSVSTITGLANSATITASTSSTGGTLVQRTGDGSIGAYWITASGAIQAQGGFVSAAGSYGASGTIPSTATITVQNGLITSWA